MLHDQAVHDDTLLTRVVAWWKDRARQLQALKELRALNERLLNQVSTDVGVPASQLLEIVERGPHAADELLAAMDQLGLDPGAIELARAQEFRDLQFVCAGCGTKRACNRALAQRTIGAELDRICPNSEPIRDLIAELERRTTSA